MASNRLCLFFTRGVSVKHWIESGLFEREKQIYEAHLIARVLKSVVWLTYGSEDLLVADRLKAQGKLHADIEILQMPKIFNFIFGSWIYSMLLPLIYARELKTCDIYKTNQMDGSWAAVLSKLLYKKPLLLRTGYTQSIFLKRKGKRKLVLWLSHIVELFAYSFCDIGVVSSYQDKDYLLTKYNLTSEKIKVIHNYIDTDLFKPTKDIKYVDRIVFVGRLNKQKNLFNLIDAITDSNLILDIYGDGEQRQELRLYADNKGAKVNFFGLIDNRDLPVILNKYKYYILPSFYEGMPKALLEALSCALICIGTNTKGVNEVLSDGVNGFLITGFDACDIYETINRVLECDISDIENISNHARDLIINNYSLLCAQKKEQEMFISVQ